MLCSRPCTTAGSSPDTASLSLGMPRSPEQLRTAFELCTDAAGPIFKRAVTVRFGGAHACLSRVTGCIPNFERYPQVYRLHVSGSFVQVSGNPATPSQERSGARTRRVVPCLQTRFRACACMRKGERYVCVPPDLENRCEREASAIRMKVLTLADMEAQRQVKWEKDVRTVAG